jgi:hypothetical protein
MPLYPPRDPFPYLPDPLSRIADAKLPDGLYAYAQHTNGDIWTLPDQPHVHPKILGLGKSAVYAGDLNIQGGEVVDLTNLSGTFQCDDPAGLVMVADQLRRQGLTIRAAAVRFFPADGSPPRVIG